MIPKGSHKKEGRVSRHGSVDGVYRSYDNRVSQPVFYEQDEIPLRRVPYSPKRRGLALILSLFSSLPFTLGQNQKKRASNQRVQSFCFVYEKSPCSGKKYGTRAFQHEDR